MDSLVNAISNPARAFRSSLIGLVLVVSFGVSGAALTPNGPHPDQPPQREILLNGLRVAVVQRPGDRAAVVCAIRAGAMFDPVGKSGLANVTAGLLLAGAGSYTGDRIRGEFDDAGARVSIETDWDATWMVVDAPSAELTRVMDLLSLMLAAPRFAPEDVEAIKKQALARVAADAANPQATADRVFAETLFGRHTYARDMWGSADTIASITPGDVRVFYDKFYGANTAVLVVAAPEPADEVIALARTRFGRWTKRKVVPATFLPAKSETGTHVVVVDEPGADTATVRAGFLTAGRSAADTAVLEALAERLNADLEGRMPGAHARADFDLRMLQSPFVVSFSAPVDKLDASMETVISAIESLQHLSTAGARTYASASSRDSTAAARQLAAADFYAGQKLAPDAVDVSLDDARLSEVATSQLRPRALTVVVVGDSQKIIAALKGKFPVEVAGHK